MCNRLLKDASFFESLVGIDDILALQTQQAGCPCGGRLDRANYPRKPRGGPADLGPAYDTRWSFCCAEDGCRRRATSFSVRFLGRRVYLGAIVILATILAHGLTGKRLWQLQKQISPTLSAKTIKRWRHWWRESFPETGFWKGNKARLKSPVDKDRLPASLLERFFGDDAGHCMRRLLEFISPLTGSISEEPR